MNVMRNRWVSISDIYKCLELSSDTIYKWVEKKGMPTHKISRSWKLQNDVDEWFRSCQVVEQ